MTELKFKRLWLVYFVTADGLYCEDSPENVINPYHMGKGNVNPLQHSTVSQNLTGKFQVVMVLILKICLYHWYSSCSNVFVQRNSRENTPPNSTV